MYRISKTIHVDMAHHVTGHPGACINIHGHTWAFEVGLKAESLDEMGFVVDFAKLKSDVLLPIHTLLDHSLALYQDTYEAARPCLIQLGQILLCTRQSAKGAVDATKGVTGYKYLPNGIQLAGACNVITGGIKITTFPFPPTSERLAEWAYVLTEAACMGWAEKGPHDVLVMRVQADYVKVFETLHPVEAVATFP